jgi:hypothetical protein
MQFLKASEEGPQEINNLLLKYNASGQCVNLDKSSVFFSKGCHEGKRQTVKNILNVPNETLNEKYIGMPFDIGRSTNGAFKYLKDRISKHIQGWLEKTMAVGGNEVLTKSVAQTNPTFSMSCFKLPRGLCLAINAMLRKFWWGSKNGKRKPSRVSWEKMCSTKFSGGMGFRYIKLFNLTMLARQAWRILQHPVTRVNSTNVLDEGLRIGEIGRRMNSKVKVSRNKYVPKVNLGVQPGLLSISPTPSPPDPYI